MGDHRAQEAKGRLKEAVGRLTSNGHLVRKGQDDRSKAKVKGRAAHAKNRVQQDASHLKDRLSGAVARATGRR